MLHTRDMTPPTMERVPEMKPEEVVIEEPLYRRDDQGFLIETGNVARRSYIKMVPTGKTVAGAPQQTDLRCHDCGAALVPAPADIYYLICGRLNLPHDRFRVVSDGRMLPRHYINQKGEVRERLEKVPSEEPYAGCVLECGGWRP